MTETQQSAPETQATPEAAPSIDDRVAELASKLTPTGDDSDYASDSLPANADKKDESEPAKEAKEESTDDPERAARKARREAIRAKQAERNAYVEQRRAQTQQRQQEAPQADIAQMQAELQRLKAVEESLKDPARFFEVAANVGVDPNGLSSWLEKAINDPHAVAAEVAAKRAKEVVSPEIEAVKQELEELVQFETHNEYWRLGEKPLKRWGDLMTQEEKQRIAQHKAFIANEVEYMREKAKQRKQ